ncbi:MAK10-like protein [Tanacetum coccineum]
MGDENPIRTLGDYSKPSHEGYRNTIELPVGNNVVLLRSDTIRTAKLRNDILMFQQHHGESLSEAWTRFKDLLQKVPHHGIDLWLQVQIFYDHVNPVTRRTIDQSAGGKLRDRNAKESWALLEDLALYDNESWNDPRDFAKPVKAIALPQDVPSTSDSHLIELENKFQCLMEAHLALTQPTQVNKITTSCEICSGPHYTQYCMKDPEQAFVEYASSRTDEAGGKWYTFKPEQNNLDDTYNPSWRSHPNLRWRQPQNSQNNFSNPPNRFQPNGSIPNRSFNNNPRSFNNQSNLEGLISNFMASQDAILSKFEADFKQQQSEMTNKIDTVLKVITDRIVGTLPSDTVKNPKLSTYPVLSARSYPTKDPQCSTQTHGSINAITIHTEQQSTSYNNGEKENKKEEDNLKNIHFDPPTPPDLSVTFITEKVLKFNSFFESPGLVPPSSNTELICTKEEDGDVMFIEIIPMDDNSRKEEPEAEGKEVEYFDLFLTRRELAYHKKLDPRENANGGVSNFIRRIKGMHVFVRNFTYIVDFMIIEEISSIIDPRLSQVVLGKPFEEMSNMTHDPPEGVVRFTNRNNEVSYKMPHKIEQYDSLSDLEKEHTKSVYLRNEEDKRRGVDTRLLSPYPGKYCFGTIEIHGSIYFAEEWGRKVVFSIWKTFGGNTRDLGKFGEETDKTTDLHQHLSRISTQKLETASQITRDAVTTHLKTTSQDLQTTSECTTQPII